MSQGRILVIDDEGLLYGSAVARLAGSIDCIVSDIQMPRTPKALGFLRTTRAAALFGKGT